MKKGGLIRASPRRSGSLTELDADAQKADNLIRLNSKDFLLMTAMMVSWLKFGLAVRQSAKITGEFIIVDDNYFIL